MVRWLLICVAASVGCAGTPVSPSQTAGAAPSPSDIRQVTDGVDRALGVAFRAVGSALADARTSVSFDQTAPCSGGGYARIAGGWSGRLPPGGNGTLALDVRVAFGDEQAGSCTEAGALLSGELVLTGDVVFVNGRPLDPATLQDSGQLTFMLDRVQGTLQRACVHNVSAEDRVVCAGDVSLEYPVGSPVLPRPAC